MSEKKKIPQMEVSGRSTVVTVFPSMSREPVAFIRNEFEHLTPLFAAAPDLLEALQELEDVAQSSLDYRPEFRRALSKAHSAIAKATGAQS